MKLTPQDVEAVAACLICGSRQHTEVSSVWSVAQGATLFATSYCHTCGSTFRSRRPRLDWYETGSAATFREIYDKSWEATRVYRYHHYVRAFRPHIKPGASILDIGSNTGVGTRFLEALGYQLFGVEQDLKRVELSRALVKHPGSIFGGSFEHYPVERRFDVIMLAHVLEHLQTPRQLLAKVRSLLEESGLAPGGGPRRGAANLRLRVQPTVSVHLQGRGFRRRQPAGVVPLRPGSRDRPPGAHGGPGVDAAPASTAAGGAGGGARAHAQ